MRRKTGFKKAKTTIQEVDADELEQQPMEEAKGDCGSGEDVINPPVGPGLHPHAVPKEPELPPCGAHQRYFEAPDGRVLVGPKDLSSIKDPITGHEINPMRR